MVFINGNRSQISNRLVTGVGGIFRGGKRSSGAAGVRRRKCEAAPSSCKRALNGAFVKAEKRMPRRGRCMARHTPGGLAACGQEPARREWLKPPEADGGGLWLMQANALRVCGAGLFTHLPQAGSACGPARPATRAQPGASTAWCLRLPRSARPCAAGTQHRRQSHAPRPAERRR